MSFFQHFHHYSPGSMYYELVERGGLEELLSEKARAEARALESALARLHHFHTGA